MFRIKILISYFKPYSDRWAWWRAWDQGPSAWPHPWKIWPRMWLLSPQRQSSKLKYPYSKSEHKAVRPADKCKNVKMSSLLSSACVRYTWWLGVRTTALVPSSTTLPPRPWPREPHAGWRQGRYPLLGWDSEESPSGVEVIGSRIIIFHPLADCIWPVSNEWQTNNIWN